MRLTRGFFRDSKDPKYDLFDHLIKIAAIFLDRMLQQVVTLWP